VRRRAGWGCSKRESAAVHRSHGYQTGPACAEPVLSQWAAWGHPHAHKAASAVAPEDM
jgi:hypothetical protein